MPDRGDVRRVLFVGHGAERSGPPIFLLHLQRWLRRARPDLDVETVLARGGVLADAFAELGPVRVLDDGWTAPRIVQAGATRLGHAGAGARIAHLRHRARLARVAPADVVYLNTVSAGGLAAVRALPFDAPLLTHVHELEAVFRYGLDDADRADVLARTTRFVAASQAVADNLVENHGVAAERIAVHHEAIDTTDRPDEARAAAVRAGLGIPSDVPVVGASGMTDWRKAPDLFVRLAWELGRRPGGERAHLVWIGGADAGPEWWPLDHDVRRLGLQGRVHFLGPSPHALDELSLCDLFVLPSREDAFPLTCLEAATLGLPVVCFDNGGMPELVDDVGGGVVVPYPDVAAMADVVVDLLADDERRARLGAAARAAVRTRHDVAVLGPALVAEVTSLC